MRLEMRREMTVSETRQPAVDANFARISKHALSAADVDADGWVEESVQDRLANEALRREAPGVRILERSTLRLQAGRGASLWTSVRRLASRSRSETWRVEIYRTSQRATTPNESPISESTYTCALNEVNADGPATGPRVVEEQPQPAPPPAVEPFATPQEPLSIPDRRRQQILEGALAVIGKKGFAGSSVREIADAAGLPIATMYQYIDSKDDLLFMITRVCMADLFDYFEQRLPLEGSPSARLGLAIRAYLRYISKNHRYINLVYREAKALDRQHREQIFDLERDFMARWQSIIDEGVDCGDFEPVDSNLAANVIYFSCTVWALRHWSIGHYTEEELARLIERLALAGLRYGDAQSTGT